MLSAKHQTKYIQVIEWTLYFGLCGLSVFFMLGVLDNFFSGKTSFSQYEEPIKELPTVMLCFSKSDSGSTRYEYGSDFKIQYEVLYMNTFRNQSDFLKEGENSAILEDIVYLEKITSLYMGNCFKITAFLINENNKSPVRNIYLYFNESSNKEDFHSLEIFFTSEKNSYGVVGKWWLNGRVLRTLVEKGMYKEIDLKPKHYHYMSTDNKCSYESFYECISRFMTSNCSLISLPSLPICKIYKSDEEEQAMSDLATAIPQCPRMLCDTLEYSGEEIYYKKLENKTITVGFQYNIPSNSMTLYEEYFIYDVISMVGSVGGTLGMCIGFSFTGMISCLINLVRNGIVLINGKSVHQKLSKFKSQDGGTLNKTMKIEVSRIGEPFNNRMYQDNELLHMEKILKIEKYLEDQEKLQDWLNAKLEETLNATKCVCLSNSLDGYSNLTRRK